MAEVVAKQLEYRPIGLKTTRSWVRILPGAGLFSRSILTLMCPSRSSSISGFPFKRYIFLIVYVALSVVYNIETQPYLHLGKGFGGEKSQSHSGYEESEKIKRTF